MSRNNHECAFTPDVDGFASFLGIAFGGDSQYNAEDAGKAIRGQVTNGGWWGYSCGGEGSDTHRIARFCEVFAQWLNGRWDDCLNAEDARLTLPRLRQGAGLSPF